MTDKEMGDTLECCKHGSSVCEPCAYDRGFNEAIEVTAKWTEEHCQFVECEEGCLCAKEIRQLKPGEK